MFTDVQMRVKSCSCESLLFEAHQRRQTHTHTHTHTHTLTLMRAVHSLSSPQSSSPSSELWAFKNITLGKVTPKGGFERHFKCSLFNFDVCSLNLTCKNTIWLLKCSCGDLIRWWTGTGGESPWHAQQFMVYYYYYLLCQHITHWLCHKKQSCFNIYSYIYILY